MQDESFTSEEGACVYGRKWFLLGANLPAPDALSQYTAALRGHGWVMDPNDPPGASSQSLTRGEHEYINLSYGGDPCIAWVNGRAPVYRQAERMYSILLHGMVDYHLPRRAGC